MRSDDTLDELFVRHFSGEKASCNEAKVEQVTKSIGVDHVSLPIVLMFAFGSLMILVELGVEKWTRIKSKLGPRTKVPKLLSLEKLRSLFLKYDVDASGAICYREFCAMANDPLFTDQKLTRPEIDHEIQEVDVDGDGTIVFEEFASWRFQKTFAVMLMAIIDKEISKEVETEEKEKAGRKDVGQVQVLPRLPQKSSQKLLASLVAGDKGGARRAVFDTFVKVLGKAEDQDQKIRALLQKHKTLDSSEVPVPGTPQGAASHANGEIYIDTDRSRDGLPIWVFGMVFHHYGNSFESHGISDMSAEATFEAYSSLVDALKEQEAQKRNTVQHSLMWSLLMHRHKTGRTAEYVDQAINASGQNIKKQQVAPLPTANRGPAQETQLPALVN